MRTLCDVYHKDLNLISVQFWTFLPWEGRGQEVDHGGCRGDGADPNNLLILRRRNKWTRILRVVLMPLESSCVFTLFIDTEY